MTPKTINETSVAIADAIAKGDVPDGWRLVAYQRRSTRLLGTHGNRFRHEWRYNVAVVSQKDGFRFDMEFTAHDDQFKGFTEMTWRSDD